MMLSRVVAAIVLGLTPAVAIAQIPSPGGVQSPMMAPPILAPPISAPSSVTTSRGAGLVSGNGGTARTIMIPGSPVPGMMIDNGNGTSSIMVPGGPSQLVPTPR